MRTWAISDVGTARQGRVNQDAYRTGETAEGGVFVLCDGMGGAKAGEVASSLAADLFLRQTENSLTGDARKMQQAASDAIDGANDLILHQAALHPEMEGMGTTIAAALVRGDKVLCANVGDSRIYHLTAAGMKQVSTDHSLVAEMVRRGELSPLEAAKHPRRNYITRALGAEPVVRADYAEVTAAPGEYLLLCSDGLYTEVSEPEIYYEVFHSGHPELACGNLVHLANRRGGRDNITIILLSF